MKIFKGGRISKLLLRKLDVFHRAPLRSSLAALRRQVFRYPPRAAPAVFFALFLAAGTALYAQTPPGLSLDVEIEKREREAAKSGASNFSSVERARAFSQLAGLRQLSGDLEGAAKNWLEAAAADRANTAAPVSAAFCLAAMGEWEQAAAAVRQTLRAARPGIDLLRAQFLNACAAVWLSRDTAPLAALAENPAFGGLLPAIYYTLWKLNEANPGLSAESGADYWRKRLLAEFPRSPEGRIAMPDGDTAVNAQPSPLWLLLPGFGSYTLDPEAPPAPPPPAPIPAVSAKDAPENAGAPAAPDSPGKSLQTGLFSREENAAAQAQRLKAAGFSPRINRRSVNGADYWAVTVPAGAGLNQSIADLKAAGFESFPVF